MFKVFESIPAEEGAISLISANLTKERVIPPGIGGI